jgi:hypothetical protein
MVHAESDTEEEIPPLTPEELAYQRERERRVQYNLDYQRQQEEYAYKGNLPNALLSLSKALRTYVASFEAIGDLSAAVMRWKAAASPDERRQCATLENTIIMQLHAIRDRGLPLFP